MTNFREVFFGSKHGATKPDSVPLHDVLENVNIDRCAVVLSFVVLAHTVIYNFLERALQTPVEAIEKSRSTRQNDVVIQLNTVVDRAALDGLVDSLLKRLGPLRMDKFL